MKKNEKIRMPLGIISVFKNEIPERYHCAAEPEILRISETHIRIRTIDQAVSWGEEVYSPRLHQNCMNPETVSYTHLEADQEHMDGQSHKILADAIYRKLEAEIL